MLPAQICLDSSTIVGNKSLHKDMFTIGTYYFKKMQTIETIIDKFMNKLIVQIKQTNLNKVQNFWNTF